MEEEQLTDEHLKQVGRICINFSALEYTLSFLIGILIGSNNNKINQILTAKMNFSSLTNLLRSLAKAKIETEKEFNMLISLLRKVDLVADQRNQIIHSAWFTEFSSEVIKTLKINKNGVSEEKTRNCDDLRKIADEISHLSKKIITYTVSLAK